MNTITIGLDIAKAVFQVHGEEADKIVLQKRLRRSQLADFFAELAPALIGIEACGSAHYWARTLREFGHTVRLIPAAYVKPFVKRNKTDARDAAAICAALGRPDMRFVAIKSVEQQAARGVERSRDLLVKQHTQLMNSVRSQLAELGIIAPQGRRGFIELGFASARDFAAWCGLTRRVDQSADKRRQRGISRQGEMRLRKLLALGASTIMRHLRSCPARATAWQHGILARRPIKVAVLAQAAKNARIAWAMLQSGEVYRRPAIATTVTTTTLAG
jgi:transposase